MPTTDLTWNEWIKHHQATGLVDLSTAFGERPWEPTEADRKAAWTLYTQLRTRIATQPLHYRAGDEETALDSLYKLFDLTRVTLDKQGPECRNLATITTLMLNRHIRPLTAKWHKKKVDDRLRHDDDRRTFRRELDALRPKLLVFCRLLASLAAADPELFDEDTCGTPKLRRSVGASGSIAFDGVLMDGRLYTAELAAIGKRRQQDGPIHDLAGLALSGGGIRSATFCQGVLQALARRGVLPDFDYLSTVSGGGYFGAFLSSFLNDDDTNAVGLRREQLPFARQDGAEAPPLRHLRNESKYLLKGGLLGQARILGLLCLGILVNLLAIAPLLLLTLFFAKWLNAGGIGAIAFRHGVESLLQLLIGLLMLVVLALPFAYRWLADNRQTIARMERVGIALALAIPGVWLIASALPQVYAYLRALPLSAPAVIGLFAALPFGLAGTSFLLGPERLPGRVLMILAGFTGPLFLLMTFLALNDWIPSRDGANALLLLFLTVAAFAWLSLINVNQISPHRYYRNRLAETYLLRRQPTTGVDEAPVHALDPQPLSDLRSHNRRAPYHLINAAVNLPASKNPELRGRQADFFVLTQDFCGSPLVDYCETKGMQEKDPNLDLGTAMAISGAAASSFMGVKSLPSLSFWLALLNVRLAYWLPNPKRVSELRTKSGASPLVVWRELFGRLDEESDYVNVSDGGHIENLGVYELLRRKCRYIIAIDAEADPGLGFGSLMQLMRYAEIDFGIDIDLDLDDLSLDKERRCKAHFAFGTIDYGNGQTGYLLYIKSSLTGNEPDYVRDYQQRNPTFPHETTADQFFSEAQFEAYRALGEHIGDDLFQAELIGGRDSISLTRWFDAMRRTLLAP